MVSGRSRFLTSRVESTNRFVLPTGLAGAELGQEPVGLPHHLLLLFSAVEWVSESEPDAAAQEDPVPGGEEEVAATAPSGAAWRLGKEALLVQPLSVTAGRESGFLFDLTTVLIFFPLLISFKPFCMKLWSFCDVCATLTHPSRLFYAITSL